MLRRVKDILRLSDFSEQEIVIYIALLKLQKATIPEIRQRSGLPNITVYRTIKKLVDREMVEARAITKKHVLYMPLTLEALVRKVGKTQRSLARMEVALKNLDKLLPYIGENESSAEDVEIRLGLDAFREEYLKMPEIFTDEYLHLGNTQNFWKTARLNYEMPEERWFINKRLSKNLFARALDVPSDTAEMIRNNDSREKRTMKVSSRLPIMNDFLMIAENQVSHFVNDPDSPRVIIIRNPELVRSHRAQFAELWKQAV